MKLKTLEGMAFELEIVGYQFPHMETEEYDSNWLMIRIDVSHPKGGWASTDPSLLTYEVADLAEWLEAVYNGESVDPEMVIIEPNLEFQLVVTENGENKLAVASRQLREQLQQFPQRARV